MIGVKYLKTTEIRTCCVLTLLGQNWFPPTNTAHLRNRGIHGCPSHETIEGDCPNQEEADENQLGTRVAENKRLGKAIILSNGFQFQLIQSNSHR